MSVSTNTFVSEPVTDAERYRVALQKVTAVEPREDAPHGHELESALDEARAIAREALDGEEHR